MTKILTVLITLITATFTFMFGCDELILNLLYILMFLMLTDIITGMISAANNCVFKWSMLRIGLFKKVSTLFIVAVAYQIDKTGFLAGTMVLQKLVISAFIGYECVSILNHIEIQGIPIPLILKQAVTKLAKGKRQ